MRSRTRGLVALTLALAAGCAERGDPPPVGAGPSAPAFPAPILYAVIPPSGTVVGGDVIACYGGMLRTGATVSVGGAAATAVSVNPAGTIVLATTPPGIAGAADVVVRNPDGGQATRTGGFTYVAAATNPAIAALAPALGPVGGGTVVTITGSGFSTTGTTQVYFGATAAAAVSVVNATTLVATTPAASGQAAAHVAVVNPSGCATQALFAFAYGGTDTVPPTFGGVVSAVAVSARAIELRWTPGTDDTTPAGQLRYAIYGATSSGGQAFGSPWFVSEPGATRFTVGGLRGGATTFFVVRARDQAGNETASTVEQSATTPAEPALAWRTTGTLATGRYGHRSARLPDGRVLLSGGISGGSGQGTASAEVYDPRTGTLAGTGTLAAARGGHVAVALETGRILVAGGFADTSTSAGLASAESYDAATGTWTATGALASGRGEASATLLGDGRVLVAGGGADASYVALRASVERFDPTAGTWSTVAPMAVARASHAATRLPDGRVLVSGGYASASTATASVEIWDPATGTWTGTANLSQARGEHGAVPLPDGRVLVVGGDTNGTGWIASAEVYDPANGTWSATASLTVARRVTAVGLPDGRVLVAGGYGAPSGTLLATCEWYDPRAGSWTAGPALATARALHTLDVLPDGTVLATGGLSASLAPLASAERLDPAAPAWHVTGTVGTARNGGTATLLADGRVCVAGGGATQPARVELYDPATGTWTATGSLGTARDEHSLILLLDGRVLVAGGRNGTALAGTEVYDPAAGTWSAGATMGSGRASHGAVRLADGRVLVCVGDATDRTAEIYDPAAGTWSATGSLVTARTNATTTPLADGRVLVAAGMGTAGVLASAELFDPATGTWTATGALAAARAGHVALRMPDGRVCVAGGFDAAGRPTGAERWDPAIGTWSAAGTLATGRQYHAATLLPGGRVLLVGGAAAATLASGERFEPETGTWVADASLASGRAEGVCIPLADGRILAATGYDDNGARLPAEVWDAGLGEATSWRPQIQAVGGTTTFPATLAAGSTVTLSGVRLRGRGVASGGSGAAGADAPLVTLAGPIRAHGTGPGAGNNRADGDAFPERVLPAIGFASGTSCTIATPAAGTLAKGHYLLRVTVDGIPSEARVVRVP